MARLSRETVLFGVCIGLAVVLIRRLAGTAELQIALLVAAGVVLMIVQIGLRHRRGEPPPTVRPRRRARRNDLYANEQNWNWTGLVDHRPAPTLPDEPDE